MSSFFRVLLVCALVASTACATGRSRGGRAAPEESPFPAREELAKIEALPPIDIPEVGEELQRWELAGPLAGQAALTPSQARDPWSRLLADAVAARPGVAVASAEMDCLAREVGRVLLERRNKPSQRFVDFAGARCGVTAASLTVGSYGGELPAGVKDAEVFAKWSEGLREWLPSVLDGTNLSVGLWFGRVEGRGVVAIARGKRQVHLEPAPLRVAAGSPVVLQGQLLEPAERIVATINRGAFGAADCESDPGVAPPRFSFRCEVAPDDPWAWVEIHALAPGRQLFNVTASFIVTTHAELPSVYEQTTLVATTVDAAMQAPEQRIADLVNAVRARAGLKPLHHAVRQSEAAHRVAPHFFAAALGKASPSTMDLIALGLQAGWDVDRPIVGSGMAFGASPLAEGIEGLVAQLVERPGSRQVLLGENTGAVAIGVASSEANGALAAVVNTYDLLATMSTDEAREAVIAQLVEGRRKNGQQSLVRFRDAEKLADAAAKEVEQGGDPRDALEDLSYRASRTAGRAVKVWYLDTHDLDLVKFPEEMLREKHLGVAIGVAPYRRPGEPWVRWVVYIVTAEARTVAGAWGGEQG